MKTQWLDDLKTEQEREEFKTYLINNKKLLDKLSKIVYNMYREVEKKSFDYESPSWAYQQAHVNGAKETLTKILSLLDINPK